MGDSATCVVGHSGTQQLELRRLFVLRVDAKRAAARMTLAAAARARGGEQLAERQQARATRVGLSEVYRS